MKFWFGTPGWGWRLWGVSSGDKWFIGLSVKQGASHDSENVAEVEALRAEVERLRRLVQERDAMLGKRLCAGTNADGKPRCLALAEEHARAERLRAEVAEAREFRDKLANAIGNDQLRRFIEKHGEPVPLIIRMQAAEARAERLEAEVERVTCELMDAITRADKLAEALKEIRSRSSINLAMRSDPLELTAMLGDIHQIAGAALAQEDDQ